MVDEARDIAERIHRPEPPGECRHGRAVGHVEAVRLDALAEARQLFGRNVRCGHARALGRRRNGNRPPDALSRGRHQNRLAFESHGIPLSLRPAPLTVRRIRSTCKTRMSPPERKT